MTDGKDIEETEKKNEKKKITERSKSSEEIKIGTEL